MAQTAMMLNSSSRGRIYIGLAAFSLIALVFFFRTSYSDPPSWKAPVPASAPPLVLDLSSEAPATATPGSAHASPAIDRPAEDRLAEPSSATSQATIPTSSAAPSPAATAPSASTSSDDACKDFPDTSDILLVMKTGATEAFDKLPVHFLTMMRCINDSIIFSDVEMEVAEHTLIDTLDEISAEVKQGNDDFKLYEQLKTYRSLLEDPRSLKNGGKGWNLDKYKFLPMLLKTWRYRNDAKWYLFVEADSMIDWVNMRTFLDKLKPSEPYYIGSPTYLDIEFAHGGTGYALSHEAMRRGVGQHPDISKKYDKDVHGICCGDRMVAKVMEDEKIKLTKAWPMFNGEKPITLPYGDNQWCQPVLTMHHMTAQEVSQVWNFQQERRLAGNKEPILWKDVFYRFVAHAFVDRRRDWDNLPNGQRYVPDLELDFGGRKWGQLSELEQASPQSPDACGKLCDSKEDCFQWMHHGRECKLGRAFTLGGSRAAEGNKPFVSGWKLDRIQAFQAKMANCTGGPDWKYTEAERKWF